MTQTDGNDCRPSICVLLHFLSCLYNLELSLVAASEQLNFGFYYFDHSVTSWG
jgi:hypothetical protein